MAGSRWIENGLVSLAVGLTALGCNQGPPPSMPEQPPAVVRVVELVQADVVDYEYFTGRIDAKESVEVRARVTGYLMDMGFKPGDEVKKKQVLFQIDRRPYQAELNRMASQVLLSKAKLQLAEADVTRAEGIAKTPGAISKQDIDRYMSARTEAAAALKSSEAMVDTAKLNLEFADVTSPIEGRVGRNLLTTGNLVVQDQTLLTTIVSENPIYAYFDIDERTLLRVQKIIMDKKSDGANAVKIRFGLANEGEEYPHSGKLDFVNNRISASTGTLQIRAEVDNPRLPSGNSRLLTPGLFIRVRLGIGGPRKGLVIPQAAIASVQSRKYLLVVNEKNAVEQRPINVGPVQPDGRQIVEPMQVVRDDTGYRPVQTGEKGQPSIKAGEKVVTGGMLRARPGTIVDPKPYETSASK